MGAYQVMVFALKEQNRIIGQLRREANANFMLLDDRSRRTQELVHKLLGKVRAMLAAYESGLPLSVPRGRDVVPCTWYILVRESSGLYVA